MSATGPDLTFSVIVLVLAVAWVFYPWERG